MKTVDLPTWFYNLDNYRPVKQVRREVRAILDTEPAFVGLCEGVGYEHDLPKVPGYELVRDLSTESRENIAAYVHEDLYGGHRWYDLTETWSRTKGQGKHPPRSFLKVKVGRMPFWVAHQPPKGTDNTWTAQWEGINLLARELQPWKELTGHDREVGRERPRVLVWDPNRRRGESGPGPDYLARKVGAEIVGQKLDAALVRNGRVSDVEYPERVGGVDLESDHGHAFRFTLTVPIEWTLTKEKT